MVRVGMVLESDYPPDIRVEKETESLSRAGCRVDLLALDFSGRLSSERLETLTVHRVRLARQLQRKLHPTLLRWPLYRSMWRRWIRRFLTSVTPDILTIHDLPLAGLGLEEARRLSVPVILDLHENFPAAIRSWGFDRGILGRYFYDLERWRALERRSVLESAGVLVVVDEALERLIGYGLAASRAQVVMNTERRAFGRGVVPIDPGGGPPLRLLYIGGLGPHRGLATAIRAIASRPDVHLRIVGDGKVRGELEALARRLNVSERVTFAGWVSADRVAEEIGLCHVGLVPHLRSDHTETTIPHKLFQYMTLGRPVLVSDCRPMARIVREQACGIVHPSGDDAGMTRCVERLLDPDLRRSLGAAGQAATRARYNWEAEAERLVTFYDRTLASAKS